MNDKQTEEVKKQLRLARSKAEIVRTVLAFLNVLIAGAVAAKVFGLL